MPPLPITADTVRSAPKVLLHDHLDGGLRPQTILELADEGGYRRLPATDAATLAAWFRRGAETRDILQYLATFEHTVGVMQTPEAIERVAYEAAIDLANDGVVYAEVRFAPELHDTYGLALDAVVEAVQSGFRRGERDAADDGSPITIGTIVCAMRTEARSLEIAELTARWRRRDPRIVAFDLAGAETGWPPSLHAAALALARQELVHITVHASEPPDLLLIHDALVHGAERIGHGVRLQADVTTDPDGAPVLGPLARSILERQICLELAPTCNVQIGAVGSVAEHPIGLFHRLGFRVTANTDNRLMSDVSVTSQVHEVAVAHGFAWSDIQALAENGLTAGFADHHERRRLLRDVVRPWYEAAAG